MQEQTIKTKRYFFPLPVDPFATQSFVGVGSKARIRTRCSQSIGPEPVADEFSYGLAKNHVTSIFPDVRRLSRGPRRPELPQAAAAPRPLKLVKRAAVKPSAPPHPGRGPLRSFSKP